MNIYYRFLRPSFALCCSLFVFQFFALCSAVKSLPTDYDDPIVGSEKGALHIVTTTECNSRYFIFQAWAQKYSLNTVSQPGNFTRIISCDHHEQISDEDLNTMDTMFVPVWTHHPTNGDDYPPYNRPVALIFWLAERKPTAEWTLIVDPDMIFRQPFLIQDYHIPEGYMMSSEYTYLIGVSNELADRHIPKVVPREDKYAGPIGRKADMSGAFFFMRTKDLVKVAPLWLKYTEDVRFDPEAWHLTGDAYAKKGDRPWISEMYGYTFATASLDLWHKVEPTTQYYPCYDVYDIPAIVHYGLNHTLLDDNYYYNKHLHHNFDAMMCPPWNMDFDRPAEDDAGLFPHPPLPKVIKSTNPRERYGQLLLIDTINTLNEALCERHRAKCSPSKQLEEECGTVDTIRTALDKEFENLHLPGVICYDNNIKCKTWADAGECEINWTFMIQQCRAICQKCRTYIPRAILTEQKDLGSEKKQNLEIDLTTKENDQKTAQMVVATRGHVAYVSSQTTDSDKVQESDTTTASIRDTSLKNDDLLIVEEKSLSTTNVSNIKDATSEILRCQSLDAVSLALDVNCRVLEKQGLVETTRPQALTISMDNIPNSSEKSEVGIYTFLSISVFIAVLAMLFRRSLGFKPQSKRLNTFSLKLQ